MTKEQIKSMPTKAWEKFIEDNEDIFKDMPKSGKAYKTILKVFVSGYHMAVKDMEIIIDHIDSKS